MLRASRLVLPAWPARPLTAAPAAGRPCGHAERARARSAGRSVRWMAKLQPSRSVSARISARWRAMRASIVGAPGLGAAGGDRAAAFRLDELDAARIGKGLFGGIDDLHHVAMRAGGRELRQRAAQFADRAPEVGQRPRSRPAATAQKPAAGSRARRVVHDRLRHLVDARCGCRSAASGPACRRARRPAPGPRPARSAITRARSSLLSCASGERNTIEGERSGQIHTVCAASHSCSRT